MMDKKLEDGVIEDGDDAPRRANVLQNIAQVYKTLTTGATAMPIVVLVLLALLVFLETRINFLPHVSAFDESVCYPRVLDARLIDYHSGHRYYAELREIRDLSPPAMREVHAKLCSKKNRLKAKYDGRKDAPFCTAPDRMNLLNIDTQSICYASVLHMIMVEVYEELQATENKPFLAYGSLLGAVRNGSMIPFTEDADIGYVGKMVNPDRVKLELRRKGYHMFHHNIWRVCVAPSHPLAGLLYDSSLPITKEFSVPYVDLYMMQKTSNGDWDLQELEGSNGRILPAE
ncbi:unnamed protein product [Phytophthora lilii]|uniref:Unnamed protein product n=1 Tax=Phytophthora lilii TaxID=2077276 RepID=A0A9W6WNA9_9STRA|nr:unnamed protein product [Phytophthora lilii]